MAKKQKIQLSDGIHTTKGDKIFFFINYVFMILLAVITLYPMLYVLFCSFSSPNEFALVRGIMFRPAGFSVEGYRMVLKMSTLWQGYRNTLIYVLVGTSISMVMTIMGAYILSHTDFMLKKVTMILIVFTMYFSGGLVPGYLNIRDLGLLDTIYHLAASLRDSKVTVDGQTVLMKNDDTQQVHRLLELLHSTQRLKNLFPASEGITVVLGDELSRSNLAGIGAIYTGYHQGNDLMGSIGIVGPVRMDYRKAAANVSYISRLLGHVLEKE